MADLKLTDQELADWLAVHVMGRSRKSISYGWDAPDHEIWADSVGYIMSFGEWRPTEDMNQAMRLLEKLDCIWMIENMLRSPDCKFKKVSVYRKGWHSAEDTNPARAICLAVYAAVKETTVSQASGKEGK